MARQRFCILTVSRNPGRLYLTQRGDPVFIRQLCFVISSPFYYIIFMKGGHLLEQVQSRTHCALMLLETDLSIPGAPSSVL